MLHNTRLPILEDGKLVNISMEVEGIYKRLVFLASAEIFDTDLVHLSDLSVM